MQNHNENMCIMTRVGTHIKHVIEESCNNVKAYKMVRHHNLYLQKM